MDLHKRCLLVACCLSLLAAIAGCAARGDSILEEEWAAVSMSGVRIGYIHSVTRRVEEPQPHIVTSVFSESRVKRLGFDLLMRSSVEYRESLDGALISVSSRTFGAGSEIRSETEVKGEKIVTTTYSADTTHTTELPWDQEVIGPYAQSQKIRASDLTPGREIAVKVFVPEFQKIARSVLTVGEVEPLAVGGQTLTLRRATMVQDILPGLATDVWLDKDGNVVRSLTKAMGEVETLRVSREEALRAVNPEALADIMQRFHLRSNRLIHRPENVREATYRLEFDSELPELQIEDRRQTVVERGARHLRLRVRALGDAPAPAERPGPEFLAPSAYIQCDDQEIIRIAREAVGEEAAPEGKARRLQAWVFRNIAKKDYSVGFASAKEVALSRVGDCTEHAVLLAALLRAAGIPSRIAVGLTYWRGGFGYHMWTEAFLNDWTAIDATLNSDPVDATHIKLAATALDANSAADPFLSLVQVIGRMAIQIEEIQGD